MSKTAMNVATVMNSVSKTRYFPGHCLQGTLRDSIDIFPLYIPSARAKTELDEINPPAKRIHKPIWIKFPRILIVLWIVKNFPVYKFRDIGLDHRFWRDRTRCWKEPWLRRECDDPRRRRRKKLYEQTLDFIDHLFTFPGRHTNT